MRPSSALARAATWFVAFIVGAVYGLAGTIAHTYMLGWFPLGLVLAVVGSAALLVAVRLLTADRWAALATGLGIAVATLVFSGRGPGGSVIVAQAAKGHFDAGLVWTIAVLLLVVLVVAWPDLSRARPEEPPAGELD